MSLYARYSELLDSVLDDLVSEGALPADANRKAVAVEPPRDPSHGDLATNAAMVLAKGAGTNPRALAALIAPKLEALPGVTAVDIAGPGFINLRLGEDSWRDELTTILSEGERYGLSDIGKNERVNVEYVSANPTGPMHMGHCRGAVVGDALARLLEAAGFRVTKEYYVNDAGSQVDTLARSAHLRYREKLGEDIGEIPEGLYPGDYLKPVGAILAAQYGAKFVDAPESEWLEPFKQKTVAAMIELIKHDLGLLGIHHDIFASEADLQASGGVEAALETLRGKGLVYEGLLEAPKGETPEDWEPVELTLFKSSQFGDDQDRPMKKSDGSWTYFGADAAYHLQKAQNADHLVNIWGADHSGHRQAGAGCGQGTDRRPRRPGRQDRPDGQAAARRRADQNVEAVGQFRDPGRCRRGSRQGRRALHDARPSGPIRCWNSISPRWSRRRRTIRFSTSSTPMRGSARCSARRRMCGVSLEAKADLNLLDADDLSLVKLASQYPRVVEAAAMAHEPHRIAFYLYDLAAALHAHWNRGNDDTDRRFLIESKPELTRARLELARGIGQVIKNGLGLMGVEAAEEMR